MDIAGSRQAPAIRGMCAISPITSLLISIKTGQRKHPDSSQVHFVQFYSVDQKRSEVEISGKLNLPMPLDVASNFSVNGACNTISGWQTLHIHVGGERTSFCPAWCHLLNGWMCGHQRPFSSPGGNWGSVSLVWEALPLSSHCKNQDCSDPNWAKSSWSEVAQVGWVPGMSTLQQAGQTWHRVCSCSKGDTGSLLFHVPIAIWRSHLIYSWTKPNKNKIKHKAKLLSMHPREIFGS